MLELNRIYCMDALEGLKQIEDKSIDLVLTDPPYNISFQSNFRKSRGSSVVFDNAWDVDFDITPYFKEIERVLSSDGVAYVFGRWDSVFPKKPSGCLVWDKLDYGLGDLGFWSMSYEFIFIFKNGRSNFKFSKRPTGMLRYNKVQNFNCDEVSPSANIKDYMKHPTQKPVSLIRTILGYHDFKLCLDPFMGSGTTAVACKQLNKAFLGFEINPEYVKLAEERLTQTTLFESCGDLTTFC